MIIKKLTVLSSLLILISCASFNKNRTTLEGNGVPTDESRISLKSKKTDIKLPTHEESYIIKSPTEIAIIADSILTNGEKAALDGDFLRAQSLMILALDLINSREAEPIADTIFNSYFTFERIGKFYVNLMPPSYLDSVPAPISPFVARYQLYEISNSLDTNNLDSSIIPQLCNDGVNYNIPISYNKRVQKALISLLSANKTQRMERLLNRAEHYRPFMIEIFEKEGLPTDLTFLPLLESAFNPSAYSWAHASGLWQFIQSTGKMFGLRNNYWLDERRDPIKSTVAAAAYLKRLDNIFSDWYLSLASYNCGEGRVKRTLKSSGGKTYWDIELPKETMNYVPLYIAYQIIAKNPHCFGYNVDKTIKPFDFDTVTVSDCIDMSQIAKGIGMDPEEFIKLNPQIKRWATPPDLKNVTLYVPKGSREKYYDFYKTLTPADKVKWHRYKIRRGDNLGVISRKFGISISAIKSVNKMKSSRIIAGHYIYIPLPSETVKISNDPIDKPEPIPAKKSVKKIGIPTGDKITYIIKSGESLYSVSLKFGVTVDDIISWNKIKNPSKIAANRKITLYGAENKTSNNSSKLDKDNETISKIEPRVATTAKQTPKGEKRSYTVKKGDNLYAISKKLNVATSNLIDWNDKDANNPIIKPNEKLIYYSKISKSSKNKTDYRKYKVKSGDTFYSIAKMFEIKTSQLQNANRSSSSTSLHPGDILIVPSINTSTNGNRSLNIINYKVKSGDNLWSISNSFNVPIREICIASNITRNHRLHPGETLKIPQKR